jgi:molecular chaperone GrpE
MGKSTKLKKDGKPRPFKVLEKKKGSKEEKDRKKPVASKAEKPDKKVIHGIEWSFDDEDEGDVDEDTEEDTTPKGRRKAEMTEEEDEEERPAPRQVRAKKIPVSAGVRKKMNALLITIQELQKRLRAKDKEMNEVRSSLVIMSNEQQENSQNLEFLKGENTKKDAIIDKYVKKIKRLNDDFDNLKDRTKVEKDENVKMASARVVKKLFNVIQNFDLSLAAVKETPENQDIIKGFKLIRKQIDVVLDTEGVEEIPALNEPFNPEFHEAVDVIENASVAADTVLEVTEKGYLLQGSVLRPSKVKVSKGGPQREEKGPQEQQAEDGAQGEEGKTEESVSEPEEGDSEDKGAEEQVSEEEEFEEITEEQENEGEDAVTEEETPSKQKKKDQDKFMAMLNKAIAEKKKEMATHKRSEEGSGSEEFSEDEPEEKPKRLKKKVK